MEKRELIGQIAAQEWELFDKVQNQGGRADCQDDRETFFIMRTSQLSAWSAEMLDSYREDLFDALSQGRNLLTEKYAYMMEHTDPAGFALLRDSLPVPSAEKLTLVEQICDLQTAWQEELAACYPVLAGQGRPIRKEEDRPWATSFETYLRGELLTYSLKTLRAYASHGEALKAQGRSMNLLVLEDMVRQYGYLSPAQAEQALTTTRR